MTSPNALHRVPVAPPPARRATFLRYVTHGANDIYWFILPPTLPLILKEFGLRYAGGGGMIAAFLCVTAVASMLMGRLSDRVPRRRLIVAGYLVYAAVYWGFARGGSRRLVWLLFILYGLYYALTEGVLKAWIADLVPSSFRASVFGIFSWIVGVVAFPASLLAGWLWQRYSPAIPFYFASGLSLLAAFFLLFCGNNRAQR